MHIFTSTHIHAHIFAPYSSYTYAKKKIMNTPQGPVTSARFWGEKILSTSDDGTLRMWNPENLECLFVVAATARYPLYVFFWIFSSVVFVVDVKSGVCCIYMCTTHTFRELVRGRRYCRFSSVHFFWMFLCFFFLLTSIGCVLHIYVYCTHIPRVCSWSPLLLVIYPLYVFWFLVGRIFHAFF